MNILGFLTPVLGPVVNGILDRIPNKNERARAKEDYEKALLSIQAKAQEGQLEINKIEAAHKSIFVAGWRPWIGWTCGVALAYHFVLAPFLAWAAVVFKIAELSALPELDTGPLFQLVLGMLGMGTLRTYEKLKGIAREK